MLSDGRDNHARPPQGAHGTPLDWMRAVIWLLWRLALYGLAIAGGIYVLARIRVILIYVVIGVILAYIMRPIADWMARRPGFIAFHDAIASVVAAFVRPIQRAVAQVFARKRPVPPQVGPEGVRLKVHVHRSIATLYVLILLFGGGFFAAKFLVTPFVGQITYVTKHWETEYGPRFDQYFADVRDWYTTHIKPEWREKIESAFQQNREQRNADLQREITAWVGALGRHLGGILHQVVEIVLLPVLAFYFALDSRKLKREFVGALKPRWRRETLRMIYEFNQIMHSYVVGQAILCALAGVVIWAFLWLLHVPFALTLGILAGLTRAIPIIGPIIGGIPIVILTLVTAGLPAALGVLAFFTFLHFAESKFVMPYLIGERMNLHPVVIILVLLVGQEFGGLLGMFFAPPLAALVRVIVRRYWIERRLRTRKLVEPIAATSSAPVSVE